jgi:hypothetical protein
MTKAIIVSLVAAIVGFFGGLAAPWIKWKVEKQRLIRSDRAALISEARDTIKHFDFDEDNFGDTEIYSRLKPYLKQETISKVESFNYGVTVSARGDQVVKHRLLDDLARLEKELWNL